MYQIKEYSYKMAKKLNVDIQPSKRKNKKIDVYKNNKKIATIGDSRYLDYPTFIEKEGLQYANQKKKLYRLRHKNDINNKDGNGYYASRILW